MYHLFIFYFRDLGITGSSLSSKAKEAWSQMKNAQEEILKICTYLEELGRTAVEFENSISTVGKIYYSHLNVVSHIVDVYKKRDWNLFSAEEKLTTENTVLMVNLLYNMCKVQVVLASGNSTEPNRINEVEINKSMNDANTILKNIV